MNDLSTFNFQINSMKDAMEYAKLISESDLAPKDFKGKPGNVLIAIQYGVEIGLKPMQAIQNISVINGRPAIWGDAMIALVQNHPLCEYIKEYIKDGTAYCTVKRRGEDEYTYEFSKEDAKQAGLLNKAGVWSQYPDRMLQMRARGFALRDKFSDVLKGIAMREEVMDYQVVDINKNSQNKLDASEKISSLIENKNSIFSDFAFQIEHSQSIKELISVGTEASKILSEDQKVKMRELYKIKHEKLLKNEIINLETGEITPNDKK